MPSGEHTTPTPRSIDHPMWVAFSQIADRLAETYGEPVTRSMKPVQFGAMRALAAVWFLPGPDGRKSNHGMRLTRKPGLGGYVWEVETWVHGQGHAHIVSTVAAPELIGIALQAVAFTDTEVPR
jgi:hypothetical protein